MAAILTLLSVLGLASAISVNQEARVLITGFVPFLDYDTNPSGDVATQLNGQCLNYTSLVKKSAVNLHVCFDGWVLPVNTTGSSLVADLLLQGAPFPYDAVLHLGLEDVAKGLKLETFAINQLAEDTSSLSSTSLTHSLAAALSTTCLNSSDYDQPTGTPAVPGASCEMPTTADLGRLSLQEAFRFALDENCRASNPEHPDGEKRNHCASSALDIVRSSPHLTETSKKQLTATLREAWSRNAGTYYCNETLFRTLQAIREKQLRVQSGALMPALFTHLPNYDAMTLDEMSLLVSHIAAQLASFAV